MVQWLGLHIFTAEGTGPIPGRGTEIPQAARCSQKNKKKKYVQALNVVLLGGGTFVVISS